MIRNLKVLFAAALALTAFGAIAASAHAVDEFHCSVTPCRGTLKPDGTGKTAHHVFIVENEATTESVSFTCAELTGEGEHVGAGGFNELTTTNLNYHSASCTVNGSTGVTVTMNGCDYLFKAANGRSDAANVVVACTGTNKIEIAYNNGCVMTVTGGFESSGIGYTINGVAPNREITATVNHVTIPAANINADGTKAQCLINPSQNLVGTYTTGNTLVTGETTGGAMAEAWYE